MIAREKSLGWIESFTLQIGEQYRSRSSRQARNPKSLPFEIIDLLDIFRADQQIGRGVARSGGDFEVAVGSFVPDDDVVGIDVGEVKLAGNQCLQLDIGSADADEIDLNSFLGVQAFFQPNKKGQVVEIFRYVAGRQPLRAGDNGSTKQTQPRRKRKSRSFS